MPPAKHLPGLGPRSLAMLAAGGIHTRADLERLGSVRAYLQTKRAGQPASLNLLWAPGAGEAEEASAAKRPQLPIFHRLFAPWLGHEAANSAKTALAGRASRYRRLLPRRLLEGALTGQHWQTVAREERTRLLLALDALSAAN